ncbi:MAG: EamA family transporter [Proteobacteria bacterium]|nr:EamA family transporter [Pseudomonadota bacterium]
MELWTGLFVLCAAAMHASWNAVVKNAVDSLVMQALIILTAALIALPFALALPFPGPETWGYILAGTIVHGFYFAFLVKAYEIGDFSHVYPISRGTGPMVVAVFAATFLGEALTIAQYAGVALVSLGVLSLALTAPGAGGTRALRYALTVGLTIATYTVIDGLGSRSGPEPFSFIAWLLVLSVVPIGGLALWRRGPGAAIAAARAQLFRGLAAGTVCGLAYTIVLWAYSEGALATVAALRETSVIFAALIGAILFGEPFGRRRTLAAAIVAAGVVAINLG